MPKQEKLRNCQKKVYNQNNGISRVFLAIYGYLWEDPIIYYFYLLRKTSIFIIYCWNITTTTFKKLKTEQSYVVKLYSILWSRNQNPPSPSLLYLNNVYYIIHIFCRLFFCVFFPISTHFLKKSYHYIILQCYIFFGYFTMYYYYCIHFYLIMWFFLV